MMEAQSRSELFEKGKKTLQDCRHSDDYSGLTLKNLNYEMLKEEICEIDSRRKTY